VVDELALRRVFLRIFPTFRVEIIPPKHHVFISFIYHPFYTVLATDSVVKKKHPFSPLTHTHTHFCDKTMQIALHYGILHSTNLATSVSMNRFIYVTPVLHRHTASGVASYDTISRDNSLSTWFQYHAFEISGSNMIRCSVPTTSASQHGRCTKVPGRKRQNKVSQTGNKLKQIISHEIHVTFSVSMLNSCRL